MGAKAFGCEDLGWRREVKGELCLLWARKERKDIEENPRTCPWPPNPVAATTPKAVRLARGQGSQPGLAKEMRTGLGLWSPLWDFPGLLGKKDWFWCSSQVLVLRKTLGILPREYGVPWDPWDFKHRSGPTPILLPGGWDTQPE